MLVAEQAEFARLPQRDDQVLDGQRILVAHVDDAFGRARGVGADQHAFDDAVRIAFQDAAVHVGARIAFVGVADQKLSPPVRLAGEHLPFPAGREAGAATPAQPRRLDLVNHAPGVAGSSTFASAE